VALDGKTLRGSFDRAAAAKLRLIVQLKDNQRTLLQQCRSITAVDRPLTVDHSQTTGRNRDERRTVSVFDTADKLAGTPWQPAIAAVIQIEREVFTRDAATGLLRKTTESALYLSNAPLAAETAAAAIRAHWGIENTSHYTRDMTMGEDRSRIRTNPGVFARLRSFGFNISKANRSGTFSQDRYRAALAGVKRLLKFKGVT
jgi:predicted transposase YbfD/YdcC